MATLDDLLRDCISRDVERALSEDIGDLDITAALIDPEARATARVITRETAVICGQQWVDEVFRQVDPEISLQWQVTEGASVEADTLLFTASGHSRSLLTAERAALNFLQTLSGTATAARHYADLVSHTQCRILDTRKTLPGLRLAQKYATRCGGCQNHRLGLWDAFLIKENHIMACGGIAQAVSKAQEIAPGKPVEVEVEKLSQMHEAIEAGADIIMLDNFSPEDMRQAVHEADGRVKLEASGGITEATLAVFAETGVDFISVGAITKHCRAIDLSMRLIEQTQQAAPGR